MMKMVQAGPEPSRKQGRLGGWAAVGVLAAALVTACGSPQAENGEKTVPASFSSMEEAYAAVDEVLTCEADPAGDLIVPRAGGQLPSEQKLCARNLQIDLYPDSDALQEAFDILNRTCQGPVHIVQGSNWMVVDLTEAATDEPPVWDLKGLAQDLNGQYSTVGT